MRIGILSDSHIPEAAEALPVQVREALAGVDLILHCGDIYTLSVLDDLEQVAPVLAAQGDDDYFEHHDERVRHNHILAFEGLRLWLTHVMPGPRLDLPRRSAPPLEQWRGSADILVFGHTHRPVVEQRDGILLLNPGSPTFPNYAARLGTVAILTLRDGKADVEIVELGEGCA